MSKFCPICDSQVTSSFCKSCKRFITPYEIKEDIHLNQGHDENDDNCDYHGTTDQQEYLYHQTTADPCLYNKKPVDDKNVSKKAVYICTAIIVAIVCTIVFFVAKEVTRNDNGGASSVAVSDETVYNPFGQQIAMDADKLAELRAEKGYGEDGIKDVDISEVKKQGLTTTWYTLWDETNVVMSRHISNTLEDFDLIFEDYGEGSSYYSYYYMDSYGDEWG